MNTSVRPLLLSLKPCYSDLIFEGLKRAELRRRPLKQMEHCSAFVYVSSPVRKLSGGFRVGKVWTGTPDEIWGTVFDKAGLDKSDFDAYYAGQSTAYALEITNVWRYANPLHLEDLRGLFENFVVPQSWRYLRPDEHECFQRMRIVERGSYSLGRSSGEDLSPALTQPDNVATSMKTRTGAWRIAGAEVCSARQALRLP